MLYKCCPEKNKGCSKIGCYENSGCMYTVNKEFECDNCESKRNLRISLNLDTTQAQKELNKIERQLDRIIRKQKKVLK